MPCCLSDRSFVLLAAMIFDKAMVIFMNLSSLYMQDRFTELTTFTVVAYKIAASCRFGSTLRRAAVAQIEIRLRADEDSMPWRLVLSSPTGMLLCKLSIDNDKSARPSVRSTG